MSAADSRACAANASSERAILACALLGSVRTMARACFWVICAFPCRFRSSRRAFDFRNAHPRGSVELRSRCGVLYQLGLTLLEC
jgi:hypothetical protein